MGRNLRALLVLGALALTGCGTAPREPPQLPAPPRERPGAAKAATYRAQAALEAQRAVRLRVAIRRARRSPTVGGALRLALLTGRLSAAEHASFERDYAAARSALTRLTGVRRSELAAVLGSLDVLAAQGQLRADRLPVTFLILRRNTAFWLRDALPAAGFRTQFGRDPAVFQYYPGRGLQLQALASWGRANGLAGACLRASSGMRRRAACPGATELRRTLDALLRLGTRRGGFLAWESYFAWGGGAPGWISGMTQSTAIQALARGATALGDPHYAAAARRALGAFEQPPPVGVSVPAPGGEHYLMYSFAPGLRILNGDLQAITGLSDMASLTGDPTALALFRRGDRAARRAVSGFDTGAWSLYSAQGREATLAYHQLVRGFLGNLCGRTSAPEYCSAHERFARYEREPPEIAIARLRGPRAHRPLRVRFALSKLSDVVVRVWSRRGTSLRLELSLPHGDHAFTWVPPRRGTFRLRIDARGPSGAPGAEQRTLRVVRPRPPRRAERERRHERERAEGVVARRDADYGAQ
jgi:hypothetical protein